MMRIVATLVGAAALLAAPRFAAARDDASPALDVRAAPGWSPSNMSVTVGGGVANFARDRLSDQNTPVAGAWDARFLYGTRRFVAVEGAYQGSQAGASHDVGGAGAATHLLTGSLRLNLTRARVQPFLAAGAGWAILSRAGSGPPGGAMAPGQSVNAFTSPFAAGVSGYIGRHVVLEARGGYAIVADKDFAHAGARPDLWSAELRAGYAF